MPYSFQDELAQLHAEAERDADQVERRNAYRRMLDYKAGTAVAVDITGRVACLGTSAAGNAVTLRAAARQQPNTLTGQVAAADLMETASRYEVEAERQRPQREADEAYRARAAELWQLHYAGAARERKAWHRSRG